MGIDRELSMWLNHNLNLLLFPDPKHPFVAGDFFGWAHGFVRGCR